MSAWNFDSLMEHVGHKIVCVTYGELGDPQNVAVECETCGVVIVDFDAPEEGAGDE